MREVKFRGTSLVLFRAKVPWDLGGLKKLPSRGGWTA